MGLPSAVGASCGFPPALSVIEIQSMSGHSTSWLANVRAFTALRSDMPPRTETSSVPTRKRVDCSSLSRRVCILFSPANHAIECPCRRNENRRRFIGPKFAGVGVICRGHSPCGGLELPGDGLDHLL